MQTHQRVSFADFILLHEGDDPVRLLLSRDKLRDLHPDIDIDLAVTTLEVRRKLKSKVPEWYSVPSLIYPFRLIRGRGPPLAVGGAGAKRRRFPVVYPLRSKSPT